MKISSFFAELSRRWSADSPRFFVRLSRIGVWLGTIPTAALVFQELPFVPVELVPVVTKIAGYAAVAGWTITLVSKLPVKDPADAKP